MTNNELLLKAEEAAKSSYSPYSGVTVGAALLTSNGKLYLGANVENASYGATICAERTAVVKAVTDGERKFIKLAVWANITPCSPCGICRQMLSEFSSDMTIIFRDKNAEIKEMKLKDLLPESFAL